ncbi:chemotaxis protein CheB [Flavobacterium aquidurense]|uniref:Signal transduction histidine kinase with CheB and CheR activity n=1 Tax=Flavobacterium aquidurense TaxID=362413 RepID=A0A0Q0W898_9FLAO|nr:chemotaxis protein CheB [Flavobacterium aquidurense]KQB42674.1 Signal transduction histidine kinase with CheB and CheR activity [Flavobacterium aquidurense]
MKPTDNQEPKKSKQDFPVVGIGASAGGLDAFKKLLNAIPVNSGMAYVLVQHLSPEHHSNLVEILSPHTTIPVHEIINDINLAPNHIYIIPENTNLIAEDGILKIHPRTRNERKNASIDIFFESLAQVHKSFAIGIILSGTAFDGTFGLKKIKELGGVTIAQDPDTAAFKGMPQSAIEADTVDYVLAPELIPQQLVEIQKSYKINHAYTEQDHELKNEEEILNQITNLILLRTGNDFSNYKRPTIRRRISRRMVISRKNTLEDYYYYLRNDKTEQDLLFNDFLIPVTYFFRDTSVFDSLTNLVFPQLIHNLSNNNLRIWVAGCATGEEAYSIAISIHEFLAEKNNKDIKVQVFASDISEKFISKARTAIYSVQDVQQVSTARLQNYFTKHDGYYHVNKVIREMCIFAVHNFIKDPPFARINLISCRNVLIYLNPFLQSKVLSSFHYSLKEKGILFLGKSETANSAHSLFEPIGINEKLYIRKSAFTRYVPEAFKPLNLSINSEIESFEKKNVPESDFRKIASDILFLQYTPASVIINEQLEIVHFHGDTSFYLLPSPGKPNFNILKMAREGISFELRNAILKMKKYKKNVIKENLIVKNQPYTASFEIVSIPDNEEYLMILFYKKPLAALEGVKNTSKNSNQNRIVELENELTQLRADIKRVTEEQQTAFEELQSTNEELLSSSEELQAMNEELETSTEELQSNNEELMCVNDELVDRQEQLISMRNYSESIFKTIREPLLIIDRDFFVKSANPSFYKYFQTTEKETEGHSFFEIGDCQWDIPEFKDLIVKMLGDRASIEDFQVHTLCKGIGKKIMMVNARRILNAKPAGMILLALEDITDVVTANEQLTIKNQELQKYNEQLETFSSAASHDLQEPLRKIHIFCQRIIDNEKNLSETSKHNLDRILFAVTNMSQLIADLIDYTRINFVEKEYKKTDLNVLLKKTMSDIKDIVLEKNAVIEIAPFPQLKVIPYQIQQLFTNLILNAVKYTKEGVIPEIKIETQKPSVDEILEIGGNKDTNYIRISISDNGIGFDQEFDAKIFEPFYRLHSNNQYHGSGLGLTLVKKIIDNHHGFITVRSKVNEGTVFFIYLPMQL